MDLRDIDFPTGRGPRMDTHHKLQRLSQLVHMYAGIYNLADKCSERTIVVDASGGAERTIPSKSDILDLIVDQVKPEDSGGLIVHRVRPVGNYVKRAGDAWVINEDYTEEKLRAYVGARLLKEAQKVGGTDGPRDSDVLLPDRFLRTTLERTEWLLVTARQSGNRRLNDYIRRHRNAITGFDRHSTLHEDKMNAAEIIDDFRRENPKVQFRNCLGEKLAHDEESMWAMYRYVQELLWELKREVRIRKLQVTATPTQDDELCGVRGGVFVGQNPTTIENDWDALRQAMREKLVQSLASPNVKQQLWDEHFAGSAEEDMIASTYVKERLKKNQKFLIQKDDNDDQWYEMNEELATDWVKHRLLRDVLFDEVMNEICNELRGRPPLCIETCSSDIMSFDVGSLGSIDSSWHHHFMSVCS